MIHRRLLLALILATLIAALAACTAPAPRPTPSADPAPATAALGEELRLEEWAVVVTAVDFNATAAVAAANEFNPAPGDGEQYALADVVVTRTGTASTGIDLTVSLVIESETIAPAVAVAPTPLHLLSEFTPGTPVSGQVAFLVPAGTDTARVLVSGGAEQSFLVVTR